MSKQHLASLDQLLPQDSLERKLEKAMDFEWLKEQLKPYYPNLLNPSDNPIRMITLVMLEHLRKFVRLDPPAEQPIEAIYETWRSDVGYMWLLHAWPQDIPPFCEIFYDPCEKLPPGPLSVIFHHILTRCADTRVAGEYPDETLYYLQKLPKPEQEAEIGRLAQAYVEQLLWEIAEVRKRDN